MIENILTLFTTECGLVALVLILVILATILIVKTLWKKIEGKDAKIEEMSENFLSALNNNTKVLTKIDEKLDRHTTE